MHKRFAVLVSFLVINWTEIHTIKWSAWGWSWYRELKIAITRLRDTWQSRSWWEMRIAILSDRCGNWEKGISICTKIKNIMCSVVKSDLCRWQESFICLIVKRLRKTPFNLENFKMPYSIKNCTCKPQLNKLSGQKMYSPTRGLRKAFCTFATDLFVFFLQTVQLEFGSV